MPELTVNGVRLHYETAGTGPAVVLVHGWPFTWREWRPLIPLLAAAGFTVIAPDLRGTGDSERPATGYTKREVAEDLHALVRELGFTTVNVAGTDIGTMVAQAWAMAYPDEVAHLVLSESLLPGFGLLEAGHWHFGFHAQLDLAEMLTAGREAAYLGGMWDVMSDGRVPPGERAEYLRTYAAPGGMRGGFQHYATLAEDDRAVREVAVVLPMPVLVLNGERGLPQPPLLAGARQMAADVRADIVPDSAYTIGLDNPEWVARRLEQFFTAGR